MNRSGLTFTGQLSAFAAARLAKQNIAAPPKPQPANTPPLVATAIANETYNGHAQDLPTPDEESRVPQQLAFADTPKPGSSVVLSTIDRQTSKVDKSKDGVLNLTLRNGQQITCVGEYEVQAVQGLATIYGAVLRPQSGAQKVHAPSTHALPAIIAKRDDTVIRIASVKPSIRKLERLSPLFRNIWSADDGNWNTRTFRLLHTAADDELQRSVVPLEIDKPTQTVLTRLTVPAATQRSRIMAIGAKSSGKSTFNRIVCNALLSQPSVKKVLYLDLDPGQPEFGPPGQVSLVEVTASILGPAFTHVASLSSRSYRLIRSHTIAATSFKDDPGHYIACAQDLVKHTMSPAPLVINSSGWVSGLGANVLADLVPMIGLSDAVILEPVEEPFVEWLRSHPSRFNLHRLSRQAPRPSPRTPAEMRAMQTMAYFHSRSTEAGTDLRYTGKSISALRPWVVNYDGSDASMLAILSHGQSPQPEFLAEVLDGSLVAIMTVDDQYLDKALGTESYAEPDDQVAAPMPNTAGDHPSAQQLIRRAREGLPYIKADYHGLSHPLQPRHSSCIALALIRAIDVQNKQLHLVTPLPETQAAELAHKSIVLVRGSFDAPEWALLEDLYSREEEGGRGGVERPWVSRKELVGIEGAVWRLRHPPMAGGK